MTDLETIELVLRRALCAEQQAQVQDLSTIHVLKRVIDEFVRVHMDRKSSEPPSAKE